MKNQHQNKKMEKKVGPIERKMKEGERMGGADAHTMLGLIYNPSSGPKQVGHNGPDLGLKTFHSPCLVHC